MFGFEPKSWEFESLYGYLCECGVTVAFDLAKVKIRGQNPSFALLFTLLRRNGRVVDCGNLENCWV